MSRLLLRAALVTFSFGLQATAWSAQAPEGDADRPPAATDAPDPRTVELRRVFYTTDSGVFRARSRWSGSSWEVQNGNQWKPLSGAPPERVREEREVLKESARLASTLGNDVGARRAGFARWLVEQGFVSEACKELDRVLNAHPSESSALALVRELAPKVNVADSDPASDAGAREWLRKASAGGASLREIALERLVSARDPQALRADLTASLGSASSRERALAAHGLGRAFPGAELNALITRAVLDGSTEVRAESTRALAAAKDDGVLVPIARALGSNHPRVRMNAAQSLGEYGHQAALEPLMSYLNAAAAAQSSGWKAPRAHIFVGRQVAYVQDFDVEVAQLASIAKPVINVLTEGAVLDVRVVGITENSAALESRRAIQALKDLTGEKFASSREWKLWWEKRQAEPAPPSTPGSKG